MNSQNKAKSNNPDAFDVLDLMGFVKILWKEKKFIITVAAISFIVAVIWSLTLQNYYRSEAILIATQSSNNQTMMSQYAGLASMAGINVQGSLGGDRKDEAIEMINSRSFLRHLLTFEDILPSIMAAESYDAESEQIIFNKEYDKDNKAWAAKTKPSYLEAHKIYADIVSISTEKNGFIKITVEHKSPVFAKEFLTLIINQTNTLIRQKDLEQSTRAIEYLNLELGKTSLVEMKESINNLIQTQIETQMMANIGKDYVFLSIEPPFIPERKSKPSRVTICFFSTVLGGIIAVLIVLIRHRSLSLPS